MSNNSDNYQRKNRPQRNSNNSNYSKGGEPHSNPAQPPETTRKGPSDPVYAKPLEVRVYDGNVERAIKNFRMMVQKDRVLSLFKEKQAYEKPSVRRRRKKNEYIRNIKENERKDRRERKEKKS